MRHDGKLTAGVIVEEDAGNGISVQLFAGDHLVHAAHGLKRTGAAGTADGWFFPWEREHLVPHS
ncbi:MAG: hypothetical protein ACYDAE_25115 [Steroidobacteraceae bacterium]